MCESKSISCICVFCGHDKAKANPQRVGSYRRAGTNWQVVCNRCRARGPLCETQDEAIRRWSPPH